MSLGLILLIILTGLGIKKSSQGRSKMGNGFVIFAFVLALIIGTGILPRWLMKELQTHHVHILKPQWQTHNLIIILGFGTVRWPGGQDSLIVSQSLSYSRIYETARLYFDCKQQKHQCEILASGGDPSHTGSTEADIISSELHSLGVDAKDILRETNSQNTFQNAQFSYSFLNSHKNELNLTQGAEQPEQIFLVTSGFHMRRSLLYFQHFWQKDINTQLIAAPADHFEAKITLIPSTFNFLLFELALHEYQGIIRYHLYNFLKLNYIYY